MSATLQTRGAAAAEHELLVGLARSSRREMRGLECRRGRSRTGVGAATAPVSHCAIARADVAFDRLELALLAGLDERDRATGAAHPAGAADAVHVGVGAGRARRS